MKQNMKLNPIGQVATRVARQARTGLLLAALALSGAACQQADFDNLGTNRPNGGTPVRIAATMPANDPNTRVAYDDDKLTLAWEAGDRLRVTSETNPASFTIFNLEEGSVTGSATAIFVGSLPEECKPPYTVEVIAPGNDNAPSLSDQHQTASGNTDHLRAHLGLRATGVKTIDATSSINLQMTRAIMRFKISGLTNATTGQNIQKLTKLTWSVAANFGLDPERTTQMELSGTPDAGIYTAYLAFDPKQMSCSESCTFKVNVVGTDESQPFRAEIITKGSITYEAGKRYTITPGGTGTDDENGVISWGAIITATGLEELTPDKFNAQNNVWLITGGGDATSDDKVTANVRTAILGLKDKATNIDLVLPNVKAVPNDRLIYDPYDTSQPNPVLRSVSLPKATSIGERAFLKCTNLTTVIAPKAEYIGMYAFNSCSNLQSISHCTNDILKNTFTGCTKLTTINAPQAKSIGTYAFNGCKALTTIDVSQATSIGTYAFNGCTSLTGIDVSQATSIGESAFNGCKALTEVDAPLATTIGNSAFYGCTALTTINAPQATTIEAYAFQLCTALNNVSLPAATSIGNSAFNGCTALTSLKLTAAGGITLGDNAFKGFTTAACDLVLKSDKQGEVTDGNKWRGYTWANPIMYEE